jgi:Ribosomal protein 60S L18 and 50S L18e
MKKQGREGKVAVVIGTITNDLRLFNVPKLTVSYSLNFPSGLRRVTRPRAVYYRAF